LAGRLLGGLAQRDRLVDLGAREVYGDVQSAEAVDTLEFFRLDVIDAGLQIAERRGVDGSQL
jgi:hypothetical protein